MTSVPGTKVLDSKGQPSWSARVTLVWNVGMFIGDEVQLDVVFTVARDRLDRLAAGSAMFSTSRDVYDQGASGLMRVGPAGLSKLVRVQVRDLDSDGESAAMAIRWEATGPGGALFPVLDADIRLTAAGRACVLTMTGSYRPPFGGLGQAIDRAVLHRIAAATVRSFLSRLTEQLADQPVQEFAAGETGELGYWLPGSPGLLPD